MSSLSPSPPPRRPSPPPQEQSPTMPSPNVMRRPLSPAASLPRRPSGGKPDSPPSPNVRRRSTIPSPTSSASSSIRNRLGSMFRFTPPPSPQPQPALPSQAVSGDQAAAAHVDQAAAPLSDHDLFMQCFDLVGR